MPVKDHLFYCDALLTFKCMNSMALTNLSFRIIKRGTMSGCLTPNANNWTYHAIKRLQASEAFYTTQ